LTLRHIAAAEPLLLNSLLLAIITLIIIDIFIHIDYAIADTLSLR